MRLFIKISRLLLTCLLVGLFDVSSASITLEPTILDLIFCHTLPKKIDLS